MAPEQRMEQFRESLGLTRTAFAKLLGVHASYPGKVARGQAPGPKFKRRLAALSKNWARGAIAVEEWGEEDSFEVPELPSTHDTKTVARRTAAREARS